MKFFQALIALLFTAVLLAGCNKTEEPTPATDAAPAANEAAPAGGNTAAPAGDAAAPTGDAAAPAGNAAGPAEPPKEEPGGWVPPAEGS